VTTALGDHEAAPPGDPHEPELRTQRLVLRPLPPRAAALVSQDPDGAAALVRASLDHEWPLPDLLALMPAQAESTPETAPFGVWVVIEAATDTVIGDIGFMGRPNPEGVVEMGYSIVPSRRRRGYAAEAARALAGWALDQPGVTAVEAETDADNRASQLVLERIGFRRASATPTTLRWRLERGSMRG
jgi:ribosomal-protein-alanine N-acetyltransferase